MPTTRRTDRRDRAEDNGVENENIFCEQVMSHMSNLRDFFIRQDENLHNGTFKQKKRDKRWNALFCFVF